MVRRLGRGASLTLQVSCCLSARFSTLQAPCCVEKLLPGWLSSHAGAWPAWLRGSFCQAGLARRPEVGASLASRKALCFFHFIFCGKLFAGPPVFAHRTDGASSALYWIDQRKKLDCYVCRLTLRPPWSKERTRVLESLHVLLFLCAS